MRLLQGMFASRVWSFTQGGRLLQDSTRFRTVSMTLEYQDGEASPKYTGVLQGRRAFSLEAHAGIPLPTLH